MITPAAPIPSLGDRQPRPWYPDPQPRILGESFADVLRRVMADVRGPS